MADVHSKQIRSYNMSRIRGKDTKPELLVRKYLFSKGYRYRLHDGSLPGRPDIILKKHRTVIFVHGCFWHGHDGCRYAVIPKTRTDWWISKITKNKQNDYRATERLRLQNWNVLIVFECELKNERKEETLNRIINDIH